MNPTLKIVLTVILYVFNVIVAAVTRPNLNDYISLAGSSTIPLMIFILPGYLYYAQTGKEEVKDKTRMVALIFAIIGAI